MQHVREHTLQIQVNYCKGRWHLVHRNKNKSYRQCKRLGEQNDRLTLKCHDSSLHLWQLYRVYFTMYDIKKYGNALMATVIEQKHAENSSDH